MKKLVAQSIVGFLSVYAASGIADVVVDGSVGGIDGTPIPSGNGFTYDIQESFGQRAGNNLFHSFREFDVGAGEHANFSGENTIENVIARVTSGGESMIAGRVSSTIADSSLWLINPAGFMFTNGASVDVDGVFHISSADFVAFADGATYRADLAQGSTLTSASISDFGFVGGIAAGSVSFVVDPMGDPNAPPVVGQNLNVGPLGIQLSDSDVFAQGIDVDAGTANISIDRSLVVSRQGDLVISGGDVTSTNALMFTSGLNSGIEITSTSLELLGVGSGGFATLQTGGNAASGGAINVTTGDLRLSGDASLLTSSGSDFGGGAINVVADNVLIENQSTVALEAGQNSTAGSLNIQAQSLTLRNGSELTTISDFGEGQAGDITLMCRTASQLRTRRCKRRLRSLVRVVRFPWMPVRSQ